MILSFFTLPFNRETLKFQHVNPEEAVQIHKDVRSKKSLGMHWGTFVLTCEVRLLLL